MSTPSPQRYRSKGRREGVSEVVIMPDEGVAYLKVSQQGWDETGVRRLLSAKP